MSRFRPYTSLGGQRATFNTCQARPVPMQALASRLQHHRNFRIGITSLLTVSALLSIGGTFRIRRASTGGVRNRSKRDGTIRVLSWRGGQETWTVRHEFASGDLCRACYVDDGCEHAGLILDLRESQHSRIAACQVRRREAAR